MYITYGTSMVGHWANYVEYVQEPVDELGLVAPEDGISASTPPTFSWTGPFDAYLFYSVFRYDLGYWSGYHPVYFWMRNTSFTMSSTWWNKIDGSRPSYWAVCGYDGGLNCTGARSFTKGVSGTAGE